MLNYWYHTIYYNQQPVDIVASIQGTNKPRLHVRPLIHQHAYSDTLYHALSNLQTKEHNLKYIRRIAWCLCTCNTRSCLFCCSNVFCVAITSDTLVHDDVIKWKHFPRYWSPVNSPHKGQWRGALMFSLICVGINGWVNNRKAGDLRRHSTNYDVIVM